MAPSTIFDEIFDEICISDEGKVASFGGEILWSLIIMKFQQNPSVTFWDILHLVTS